MPKAPPVEESLPLTEHRATSALAVVEPSVGQLLQTLIERGNPEANIGVLERLIALKERADARQAEREFSVAFAKLQTAIGSVEAKKAVPNRDGSLRIRSPGLPGGSGSGGV